MLTDSLLDFLHLYACPTLLFDLKGQILYANQAAELCDGGDTPTEIQAQRAIFGGSSSSSSNSSNNSSGSGASSIGMQSYVSRRIPSDIQTTMRARKAVGDQEEELTKGRHDDDTIPHHQQGQQRQQPQEQQQQQEFDFSFTASPPAASGSSASSSGFVFPEPTASPTASASSSSSSSSSSSTVEGISPPSTARQSDQRKKRLSTSNHDSERRTLDPRSPSGQLGGSVNTSRDSTGKYSTGKYSKAAWHGENVPTPTGEESTTTIYWKVTRTKCQRVVAIAQEKPAEILPTASEADLIAQREIPPVIRIPWQEQPRFQPLKMGGGLMGDRIRNFDWANHPLGAIDTWPQGRIEMVGLILRSPVPMTAYMEDPAYVIYNDAYIAVLGQTKHKSGSLGKPAREVWAEIWEHIEIPLANAMKGIPTERQDQLLFFERLQDGGPRNKHEEVHASWYYIPYWGNSRVIGNLHMLFESHHAIHNRRFNTINDLSAHVLVSRSTIDLCRNALEVLAHLEVDLPYCLAYTAVEYNPPELLATPDGNGEQSPTSNNHHISISSSASSYSTNDIENQSNVYIFALQETVGCAFDSTIAPSRIVVDTDEDATSTPLGGVEDVGGMRMQLPTQLAWQSAMLEMVKTGNIVEVTNIDAWLGDTPHRGLPGMVPYRGVLIPLKQGEEIVACIALALNPALPWSDDLKTFIHILSRQMNLSLSMVKTYEQEVQRAEELAQLDRAKTSFFTSISHELRTPLTLILGPIKDLTSDTSLTRSQASSISLVYRNARRLLRLVNSILDFARAEAGKLSSQFTPLALGIITSELASSFRSAIESAGISFVVENNTPHDLLVWADIDKWEKIVFNLISNAFKFTTEGKIRVTTSSDALYFYLEVQDSGVGIPANEISSIFERFVRVENNQARSIEGSGIGLSLTLELVKAHGGKIGVESVWHKGTSFKLKIPLGNEHLPKQYLVNPNTTLAAPKMTGTSEDYQLHAADSAFGAGTGTGTRSESNTDESPDTSSKTASDLWPPLLFGERQRARILLADDNADLRLFIRSILGKYADVTEAVDGEVAWKLLREDQYDLVLSDIMMPRMNGFQLLANIRAYERTKSMPVILLSARAGEDAGIESLSSGADDHLNKPFSSKELILRVHSHLQLAAIRSELEVRVSERTAALEESRETFKRLSELLQVGVHRSDREGNIIWANRKWFQVLGLEDGNWNGWSDRIHPDDREEAARLYLNSVETGEGYKNPVEMRLLSPDGTQTDITYELQAERSAYGDCIGFVGVFSDVSILRKLERDRMALERQRREEAEQNRQLQEHFIDVTCHELRNPLNAISNSAELLGESLNKFFSQYKAWSDIPAVKEALGPLEADLQDDLEAVETILLSSRHQKRIADDVLHISKISGNLVQLVQNEWKPEEALRNVMKMFNLEILAKSIEASLEIHPSFRFLGDVVIGDEGRFVQVCVNLLANAIKFLDTSPRKQLRIRVGATPVLEASQLRAIFNTDGLQLDDLLPLCEPYGNSWDKQSDQQEALLHCSFYDSGPGISKEEQGRIFLRFAQASPKTFGEFGGFGLGLWISKRLVELQGGAVALQSVEGVGTIFRLYIKVQRPKRSSVQGSLLPPDAPAVESKSSPVTPDHRLISHIKDRDPIIMVVEDNDVNLKVLARLLKTLKCDVITACDGSESIAKINDLIKTRAYPPVDLIFMDLEMPIMDGLTASRNIRESEANGTYTGKQVPIVAVSANARQVYADLSTEAGMNGFLRKPYSKAQLSDVLKQFIVRE